VILWPGKGYGDVSSALDPHGVHTPIIFILHAIVEHVEKKGLVL